jgi:hypothetical protein
MNKRKACSWRRRRYYFWLFDCPRSIVTEDFSCFPFGCEFFRNFLGESGEFIGTILAIRALILGRGACST